MKIKWIGKCDGNNLPVVYIDNDAKSLPDITTKSIFMLVPILIIFAVFVYFKGKYLGGISFSRSSWMIGLVIALFFYPVHEILHAVCCPKGSEVIMFYTIQGLGTTCITPMTRNRFIFFNLFPSMILGFMPLVLFMIIPNTYAFVSTVLCVFSLVHLGSGYVDYLNILHLLMLPKDATIQISGSKIYWK